MDTLLLIALAITTNTLVGFGASFIPWGWVRWPVAILAGGFIGIIACEVFRANRAKAEETANG